MNEPSIIGIDMGKAPSKSMWVVMEWVNGTRQFRPATDEEINTATRMIQDEKTQRQMREVFAHLS